MGLAMLQKKGGDYKKYLFKNGAWQSGYVPTVNLLVISGGYLTTPDSDLADTTFLSGTIPQGKKIFFELEKTSYATVFNGTITINGNSGPKFGSLPNQTIGIVCTNNTFSLNGTNYGVNTYYKSKFYFKSIWYE